MKHLTLITVLASAMALLAIPGALAQTSPDFGYVTLDDANTRLHYYAATTDPQAWASGPNNDDTWELTVATSCDALVRIEWFDYYPTQDVYELWVDGLSYGTNPADGKGSVDTWLSVGSHTIVIDWMYYLGSLPPITGGSWYEVTFEVIDQEDCYTDVEIDIKLGSERIEICHVNGSTGAAPFPPGPNPTVNITYGRIITVAAQAHGTHMAHGDGDVQFNPTDNLLVWVYGEAFEVAGNSNCAFNVSITPEDVNGDDPNGGGDDPGDTNGVVEKTTICHKGKKTLSVGNAAVPAHLSHGDAVGACP